MTNRIRDDEFKIEITAKLDKILRTRSMIELHALSQIRKISKSNAVPERIRPKKMYLTAAMEKHMTSVSSPSRNDSYHVRSKRRVRNVNTSQAGGAVMKKQPHKRREIELLTLRELPRMKAIKETPGQPKTLAEKWCPKKMRTKLTIESIRVVLMVVLLIFVAVFAVKNWPRPVNYLPPVTSTTIPDGTDDPILVSSGPGLKEQIITCLNKNKEVRCRLRSGHFNETQADGYLFYEGDVVFKDFKMPRGDAIWGLFQNYGLAKDNMELLSPDILKLFNVTATFSRYSDIAFPLVKMPHPDELINDIYLVNTTHKNSLLFSELAPVLYWEDECDTLTGRDEYVKKLMEYIPVDSYGACLHNKEVPDFNAGLEEQHHPFQEFIIETRKMNFFARYKFFIVIESSICNDLIAENFWFGLFLGVVPIYFGSPTITDYIPYNKSVIFLKDHPSPQLLSQHLYDLIRDDSKYEEYLKHKSEKLINVNALKESELRPYQTDFGEILDMFVCDTCVRIHRGRFGEHFHANQTHFNCSLPISALELSVNYESPLVKKALAAIERGNELYRNATSKNMLDT